MRGQATLEFAFVAPLFLVCFLASIDAGLWAVENGAEVAAVEQAARLAAASGAAPVGAPAPDSGSVTAAISARLQQSLFATRIAAWPGDGCPSAPAQVEATLGPRTVALCVEQHVQPACTTPATATSPAAPAYCEDPPTVRVRLIGHVASLVPPGFGVGGSGGELPADVGVTTHTLRFAP